MSFQLNESFVFSKIISHSPCVLPSFLFICERKIPHLLLECCRIQRVSTTTTTTGGYITKVENIRRILSECQYACRIRNQWDRFWCTYTHSHTPEWTSQTNVLWYHIIYCTCCNINTHIDELNWPNPMDTICSNAHVLHVHYHMQTRVCARLHWEFEAKIELRNCLF